MGNACERNSAFELLRLIAQYMIVVYHVILFCYLQNEASLTPEIHKAICIPLHIGVILYVLISGYFGIRFSLKGVVKIIANLFLYGFVFAVIGHFCLGDHFGPSKFFFISNSPFWFVNVYLMLYMIAPLLNVVISRLSKNNRLLLLLLLWASGYVGLLGFDDSLHAGKNLLNFILVYLIGNTLSIYKEYLNAVPIWKIIMAYIVVNVLSISIYLLAVGSSIEELNYDIAFRYNSPLLILNAVIFFIPFMRMKFHSKAVNYLAGSCFAIYLIHSSNLFLRHPIRWSAIEIQSFTSNIWASMGLVMLLAIVICLIAIGIDKLMFPYWRGVSKFTDYLNKSKIGNLAREWANL